LEKLGEIPTRKCIDCSLESSNLTLFVKEKKSRHGRRNLCISCAVIRNEAEPKAKEWKTDHQTRKRYGIDVETYNQRMKSSKECQVCGAEKELCYDHCHVTMKFRGILCRRCNRSIGQLGDNSAGLQKALDYLKEAEKNE
jgi:hypothetical protein